VISRFVSAAQSEYFDAINYYDDKRSDLGLAFSREIERTINFLVNYPNSGALIAPGIRRCLVTRFPYVIIYKIEGDALTIISVSHSKRYPNHWKSRLDTGE